MGETPNSLLGTLIYYQGRPSSRTAIILQAILHGVKCSTTIMDHAGAMASLRLGGGRYVPTANGRSKDALE
jgi:hypothetical protein